MSDEVLDAVWCALPAPAAQVRAELGMTHEDTYAALVALEAQGVAFVVVSTPRRGRRTVHWEPA